MGSSRLLTGSQPSRGVFTMNPPGIAEAHDPRRRKREKKPKSDKLAMLRPAYLACLIA